MVRYRLTVYAPYDKSTNPNEDQVMTPLTGAPHSDPFQVATAEGVTGFQPLLELPRGWGGKLSLLKKTTSTGEWTFRLMDRKTGTGNLERWVTAFTGDAEGASRLSRCKVLVEQDTGSGFAPWLTGRVRDFRVDGKVWMDLVVRDLADDQDQTTFMGWPHRSVSYAQTPNLIPLGGFVSPWANFPQETDPARGRLATPGAIGWGSLITNPRPGTLVLDLTLTNERERIITKTLFALMDGRGNRDMGQLRLKVKYLTGSLAGQSGELGLANPYASNDSTNGPTFYTERNSINRTNTSILVKIGVEALPTTHPEYVALGSAGDLVEFSLHGIEKPSGKNPLYLDDVHPVTLWRDILDGKFGPYGEDGEPLNKVVYDAAAFSALESDASFLPVRAVIREPMKMNTFIEDHILQVTSLAWTLNAQGQVTPLDLRPPSSVPEDAVTNKIVDADLVEDTDVSWGASTRDMVTRVEFTYYMDYPDLDLEDIELPEGERFPDLSPTGHMEQESLHIPILLQDEAKHRGSFPHEVDATTLRYVPKERLNGQDRMEALQGYMTQVAQAILGPYGGGAQKTATVVHRNAKTATVGLGTWRVLELSEQVNTASNTRGGQRLALCVGVEDDGPVRRLEWVDAGPGTVAVAPTGGTLAAGSVPGTMDIPVTLNAAEDPVEVQVAITETSVTARPATTSALWGQVARVEESGTVRAANLAPGKRAWVRFRSVPTGAAQFRLPSPWAYPTEGYIDLSGLVIPSGLGVTSISKTTALVSWTPGSPDVRTQVLLFQGTVDPTWSDAHVVTTLPAGSTQYTLANLSGPTVDYRVAVRHLDPAGHPGGTTSAGFGTNSTDNQAPKPVGVALATPVN